MIFRYISRNVDGVHKKNISYKSYMYFYAEYVAIIKNDKLLLKKKEEETYRKRRKEKKEFLNLSLNKYHNIPPSLFEIK